MAAAKNASRVLIYVLRRDLHLADNPVFHEIVRQHKSDNPQFTHVLPIYIYAAQQIEVSGFIPAGKNGSEPDRSPYPEARSAVAGFWRCGPHRAKFIAESIWDLKKSLKSKGSDLIIRAGLLADVVRDALDFYDRSDDQSDASASDGSERAKVVGVWMTDDECVEEKREEREVRRIAEKRGVDFRLFDDEKFYIDDRDQPFQKKGQLPNIFTEYRKSVEPLRNRPRKPLVCPSALPPIPPPHLLPPQSKPFVMPETLKEHIDCLQRPLTDFDLETPPVMPKPWKTEADSSTQNELSAHPFIGGENAANSRLDHLLASGAMTDYKETRNGLLGPDFSTKLSAWLALGCISSREVHARMVEFEDGDSFDSTGLSEAEKDARKKRLDRWRSAPGFGKGENKGTAAVRFELLWRDYFRLYARKFGPRIFHVEGPKGDTSKHWKGLNFLKGTSKEDKREEREQARALHVRFRSGRTGLGLVDASQRELYLTGYTSNRARQNVASFLSKHLQVDWRIGAEWYECMLIDYDTANNWGNWQYVAGVGNDPRQDRVFNPVKQALDYDPKGEYIRTWVPELRGIELEKNGQIDDSKLIGVFQAWRLPEAEKERLGLKGEEWVDDPLKRIDFTLGRRPRPNNNDRGKARRTGRPGRGPRTGRWRGDASNASGSSGGTQGSRGSSRGLSPHRGST